MDTIGQGKFKELKTESELYETFVGILKDEGHISSADALSTFNLALSLRSAAPRIEAHYNYYDTAIEPIGFDDSCAAWVAYDGNQYCSPIFQFPSKEGLASV